MIADSSKLKAKYKLAVVKQVKISRDNLVRSAVLHYNNIQNMNNDLHARPVRVSLDIASGGAVIAIEHNG